MAGNDDLNSLAGGSAAGQSVFMSTSSASMAPSLASDSQSQPSTSLTSDRSEKEKTLLQHIAAQQNEMMQMRNMFNTAMQRLSGGVVGQPPPPPHPNGAGLQAATPAASGAPPDSVGGAQA